MCYPINTSFYSHKLVGRTHNKANEIFSFSAPSGVPAPVYDGGSPGPGNMTTMPKVGAWTTGCALAWDAWNRLVSYNDGATTTYKYDALTRRISKTTTTETRDFYFDKRWRCIEERVGASVKAHYTWHPNDRWTLLRRKRSVSGTLDEVRYVLKDYLDPAAIVTTAGAVDERYSYDAFGPYRLLTPTFGSRTTSSCAWNFLFHAEFMDQESGLYNYGYRYYQVNLGRWLSRDPLGEQDGGNIYAMNRNEAVDQLDYLGLEFIPPPGDGPKESPTRDRAFGFTSLPQLDISITCVKCTNNCYRLNKDKFDVTIKRSFVFTKEYNARTRQNVDLPRSIIDAIKAHEQRHIDDARRFHDAWNEALDNMMKGGCAFKEEQECKDSARAIENGVKEALNALNECPGMHEPINEWPDVEIIQNKIDEFKRGLKRK